MPVKQPARHVLDPKGRLVAPPTPPVDRAATGTHPSPTVVGVDGDLWPCVYLERQRSRELILLADRLEPGAYRRLLDENYRRWACSFARPVCSDCAACHAIRVPVELFIPSRAQRRCVERNRDVDTTVDAPMPTGEKQALYSRYLWTRHDGKMTGCPEEFAGLFVSPIRTMELVYRVHGRLLGATIIDIEPDSMSAVYCYFDPNEAKRSPGVFNVLTMIDLCRRWGLRYLYLGYWVRGYPKTQYMLSYRPHQLRARNGRWWTFFGGRASVAGSGVQQAWPGPLEQPHARQRQ